MVNIYEINTPTKKVLKSAVQKDVTVYKCFFMPLCAILGDNSKDYWLMEHFNNFYCVKKKKKDGYNWLDYLETNEFTEDVLKISSKSYDEVKDKDIIESVKEQINKGCYAIPFVDEFFLDCPNNGVRHYISDLFIIGYDDEKEELIGIGYSDTHAIQYATYPYEDIRTAFASFTKGIVNIDECYDWVRDSNFSIYELLDTEPDRKFNYDAFKRDIKYYFTSEPLVDLLRPQNVKEFGNDITFGMDGQDEILKAIKDLKKGILKTDYRQVHLLSEHKKMLVKKFNYINEYVHPLDKSILDRCKEVATNFEFARIIYLKNSMKLKSLFECLTDEVVIDKIAALVEKGISIEKEYLNDYLNQES